MIKIIINPVAGQGRTQGLWQGIEARIKKLGVDYSAIFTQQRGDAIRLAQEATAAGIKEIFILGGDGTANEVINGIDLNRVSLGIIPTGSGNDLGKMLGIRNIDEGLLSLSRGNRRRIDLGRTPDRLFANNLGLGFDAHVAVAQKRFKNFKGNSGYLLAVLRVLHQFKATLVEVALDEHRFSEKIMSFSVGNGKSHGGCFKLTPDAQIQDGLLDICVIRETNKAKLIYNIPRAIRGTLGGLKEVRYFRAKKIYLSAQRPLFIHLDGETLPEPVKEIQVEILPNSLEVFIP